MQNLAAGSPQLSSGQRFEGAEARTEVEVEEEVVTMRGRLWVKCGAFRF
jgi:hypothetical protein